MAMAPRERGASLGKIVPHLFLSHSSKDKPWVTQLAQDLNLCGVDVWLDTWELRVGDDLHERIGDAVDKSRFVGVVVTRNFSESKWIRGEVHQALSREKAGNRTVVLPLLADDVEVPPLLSTKKYLDFSKDYLGSLVRLSALIHDLELDVVEDEIQRRLPKDVRQAIRVLERAGWTSRHIVGTKTLAEIEKAGGTRSGDVVSFYPEEMLRTPGISEGLRRLLKRLISRT